MSENANNEALETEKPVQNDVKFPPFPDPSDKDFDEDIPEEERTHYKIKFEDLNSVKSYRLHCTSCDRHLGCSARNERMRMHPMLRTLVCHTCHTFYNSGEFEKGDDGSELYCRWCGQGGQVYCCSDCPHVFCAKCIKRNLGISKIKEIENADDWKCFKCKPECLIDLRALCWAVLRFCDMRNKITYLTEDPELKTALQIECALDPSECCLHKTNKRNQRISDASKKKEIKKEKNAEKNKEKSVEKATEKTANVSARLPGTIQVKKFASVNLDDSVKVEKKAQKRPASPKIKPLLVTNPVTLPILPIRPKILKPTNNVPPLAKKIRLPNMMNSPIRYPTVKPATYTRIRPKGPQMPMTIANFNGYSSNLYPINDNINLSLESLTQGLDMAAVAALSSNSLNDDVVCTPDFPMEPLCEVTEDNDDDVECITPGPVAAPKVVQPPPLVPRAKSSGNLSTNLDDISSDNIIQMTDNDVTVNETTGGLKFRVDPQTLSSNKMYRLPDGRIFAINANSHMPGGYSATIVAVTEANKTVPKATYAAKLSAVSTSTPVTKKNRNQVTRFINPKHKPNHNRAANAKLIKTSEIATRECDLSVPIEWYRYNLVDAVDALEYSLSRLQKLKTKATSVYLRSRSINEMRGLHRTLERLLSTSSTRFTEIRTNLNKGLKNYLKNKSGLDSVPSEISDDDDDDVEILQNVIDDPIFIDEDSVESNMNGSENQEVDLTGPGSSEHNDSGEHRNDTSSKKDPLSMIENEDSQLHIINVRSMRDIESDDVSESDNMINGVQNKTTLLKTVLEKNCLAESKNEDENGKLTERNTMLESDDKVQESDGILQNSDDKMQSYNDKDEESDGILQDSDDKMQSNEDKLLEPDVTLEISDDKIQEPDDKEKECDKIIDSNDIDTDENIVTNDVKTEGSENKSNQDDSDDDDDEKVEESATQVSGALKEELQDTEDKTLDSDNKIQEMSQELIDNLLKDENSCDSTTNSEVPKALSVT